ncbi:hypothetical protein EWB00_009453 [Schistosoma japonicum]|uniref:HMG box domain-containing protein n=1 Tax=Schistosoma japonicum TaxID=6182 RepID=A0A4Z2CM52_SCHJA|nr:hypothetical protein EWB00_009453 [Schistosoma japonicum]
MTFTAELMRNHRNVLRFQRISKNLLTSGLLNPVAYYGIECVIRFCLSSNHMQFPSFSSNNFLVVARQLTSSSAHNNAYTSFIRSRFHEVKSAKPELSNFDVFKKLSKLYKSLPAEEVEKLKCEANERQSEIKKATRYAYRNGMPRSPPNSGLKVFMKQKLKDCKVSHYYVHYYEHHVPLSSYSLIVYLRVSEIGIKREKHLLVFSLII